MTRKALASRYVLLEQPNGYCSTPEHNSGSENIDLRLVDEERTTRALRLERNRKTTERITSGGWSADEQYNVVCPP